MKAAWLLVCAGWLGAACSLEPVKSGGACQRSTQCAAGLACVAGKCGKDLSSIAAHNTVPMLGNSAGSAAGGGAMMQAGAAEPAAGGGAMEAGSGGG